MNKLNTSLCLFLIFGNSIYGQSVSGKLSFVQGKMINIDIKIKSTVTQQAMGNAIDFVADGYTLHRYKISATTGDNTTLYHDAYKIAFNFEGMSQKRTFNSDNETDMAGQFGDPVKKILDKKFEMTIDPFGTVKTVRPEKMEPVIADERLTIVLNMLKDITDVVYPPQKGDASFFKVLPAKETAIGESWTDSLQDETGKFKTNYNLSSITDSTIIVDFNGTAVTVSNAMMMGRETITTLNSISSGRIIVDKTSGIIKEKKINTESHGNTEAMGGTMPVSAKTTITILVKPE
ncbi:MAG: DUF6263 family protein [Chitinophagaceae bacterium]